MIEAMPRPRKPYVQRERTRHGRVVWYFRKGTGPRIRLPGDYESPEWLDAYMQALGGGTATDRYRSIKSATGTLEWLINRYFGSTAWAGLSVATKKQRRSVFTRMIKSGGDFSLSELTRALIVEGRDRRSEKASAAVSFVKAMRGLCKWAVEAGHLPADPTEGVTVKRARTDGHTPWTLDQVAQFYARWPLGTMQRLACDIMLYTGMRISDACRLGRQHIKDGVISYRAVKNGEEIDLPMAEPLRQSIEAAPSGTLALLVSGTGQPFASSASFGNWFRDAVYAANLKGVSAHGLRKLSATLAAENGATDRQLMAMYGWRKEAMASVYTRKADRRRLAHEAAKRVRIE